MDINHRKKERIRWFWSKFWPGLPMWRAAKLSRVTIQGQSLALRWGLPLSQTTWPLLLLHAACMDHTTPMTPCMHSRPISNISTYILVRPMISIFSLSDFLWSYLSTFFVCISMFAYPRSSSTFCNTFVENIYLEVLLIKNTR